MSMFENCLYKFNSSAIDFAWKCSMDKSFVFMLSPTFIFNVKRKSNIADSQLKLMLLSSDVSNRSKLNKSMRHGTIAHDTFCSIIKDEAIVPDDSDYNAVCTKDDDSIYSSNNVGEIEDITINAAEVNGESSVEMCDSDAKKRMSNNSTIDHVYIDEKVSEYPQLCFNCGVTSHEVLNQTELCKATKSFTCSVCSFKCCSENNLEYHMQNDHKISMKYPVTSDSKEKERSKLMNNSSNETYPRKYLIVDRKKDIELYCVMCDNVYNPKKIWTNNRQTCGVCRTNIMYQCKIYKKRYSHPSSIYNHLKNYCINVEAQYKCSQCDYKTKRKGDLRRHVTRKHSVNKCTRCGQIFNDFCRLREHQLLKCNLRYTCSQCDKKYIYLKSFNNHKKNGCASKIQYECNHCSYITNRKYNLKLHIKSKHSEIFLFGDSL